MASTVPAVETHPQREKILNAILNGDSARKIASWCNPPLNQSSIHRYAKTRVAAAIRERSKVTKALKENELMRQQLGLDPVDPTLRDEIKAVALTDPILDKVDFLWSEAKSGLSDAREAGDLSARSKFLSVGAKIVDTEGKARLHPGFAPAVQQGNTTINQLVLMPTPEQRAALMAPQIEAHSEVVDAEFFDVPSSEA